MKKMLCEQNSGDENTFPVSSVNDRKERGGSAI